MGCVCVCTFITLHSFHKDAATLWKDPVVSPEAVLSNCHRSQ